MDFDIDEEAILSQLSAETESPSQVVDEKSTEEQLVTEPERTEETEVKTAPVTDHATERPPVPYARLQKVVSERNALKAEIEALQTQLRTTATNPPRDNKNDDEHIDKMLDDILAEGRADDNNRGRDTSHLEKQVQELSAWRSEQEHQYVLSAMTKELDETKAKFPDVPPEFLIETVKQYPHLSFNDAANNYMKFYESVAQKVSAKTQVQVEQKRPTAPTRPSMGGGQPPLTVTKPKGGESWDDLEERILSSLGR